MGSLGIRHIALNVSDPQRSKEFYTRYLGMTVEWEPDPDNVYLTTASHDNLALHRGERASGPQSLDHFGFIVETMADVDDWYVRIREGGIKILREIKTHRDGARSFYFADPDGNVIQVMYHPPISKQ